MRPSSGASNAADRPGAARRWRWPCASARPGSSSLRAGGSPASSSVPSAATLNLVRDLLALRRATPALRTRAATRVLHEGYPFTYLGGGTHLVVVNPRREPATL